MVSGARPVGRSSVRFRRRPRDPARGAELWVAVVRGPRGDWPSARGLEGRRG